MSSRYQVPPPGDPARQDRNLSTTAVVYLLIVVGVLLGYLAGALSDTWVLVTGAPTSFGVLALVEAVAPGLRELPTTVLVSVGSLVQGFLLLASVSHLESS